MNRYGAGGASKATASTLCQKCLKKDIYECKAVAQERPYVSRPSRTQQLFNPKLVPKLTSEIQDILRKKGVADEQLAKIESERGRKRNRTDRDSQSRSESSCSSLSVTSISTNASISTSSLRRSPSTATPRTRHQISAQQAVATPARKRRRSASSEDSPYPSDYSANRDRNGVESSRSIQTKITEMSPPTNRERNRSRSGNRRLSHSSEDRSRSNRGGQGRSEKRSRGQPSLHVGDADVRPYSRSPDRHARRNEPRNVGRSPNRRPHSRRRLSLDEEDSQRRGRHAVRTRQRDESFTASGHRQDTLNRGGRRDMEFKTNERSSPEARPLNNRSSREDRSLSPFSKRLALTQAMNMGR